MKYFIAFLFIILNTNLFSQDYAKVDSLKNELQHQTIDSAKVKILNELAWNIKFKNLDSSIAYSNEAMEISENCDYLPGLAEALKGIGNSYDIQGNSLLAEKYYLKALNIFEKIRDTIGIANCYNNLGNNAKKRAAYIKASEFLFKALKIYESKNDSNGIVIGHINIGIVYNRLKDYDKALFFLQKAAEIAHKINNLQLLSSVYVNMGMVYINLKDYNKSIDYYNQALEIKKIKNDIKNSAGIYTSIGELYVKKADYVLAESYFEKALEIKIKFSDSYGITAVYEQYVKMNIKQKNYSNALNYNKKNIDLAQKHNYKDILLECYKNYEVIFKEIGNYPKAYEYLQKYSQLNDTINGTEVKSKIAEFEKHLEIEKRESEIKLLKAENEYKSDQVAKKKQIIRLWILISVLFILIALFSFIAYQNNRKKNVLLGQQNEEIKSQRDYISSQRDIIKAELTETIVKTERLQRENLQYKLEALKNQLNPHFLFNTFSTLISLIPEDQKLAENYARNLSNVYRYILTMHDKELASIREELEFINAYMFMVTIRFDNKVTLDVKIDEHLKVFYIPSFSLQLLVENAVKHNIISNKRPLKILIENEDKKICVKNNLQKKPSAENSTGIGLNNIISRYQFLSHEIVEIICTENEFIVKLPIINSNSRD